LKRYWELGIEYANIENLIFLKSQNFFWSQSNQWIGRQEKINSKGEYCWEFGRKRWTDRPGKKRVWLDERIIGYLFEKSLCEEMIKKRKFSSKKFFQWERGY